MEDFILEILEGVGSINFDIVWKILIFAFIIFWIVVLDWIWADSGERTSNKRSRILYVILAILFNVFGWLIYLIIRPNQTIEEVYWADLERRYLKYETSELGDCPKCGTQLYPGFLYCPNCNYRLKRKCPSCGVYVDKQSNFCPFCGAVIKTAVIKQEIVAPSIEEMQKQNIEVREELTEVVETQGTKYSGQRRSVFEKLGGKIIGGYKILASGIVGVFKKKEPKEKTLIQPKVKKNKKKHSSKKKRQKR